MSSLLRHVEIGFALRARCRQRHLLVAVNGRRRAARRNPPDTGRAAGDHSSLPAAGGGHDPGGLGEVGITALITQISGRASIGRNPLPSPDATSV